MNSFELAVISILVLWNLILSAGILIFYRMRNTMIANATKWMSHMGKESGQVRHSAAQTKRLASGQAKVIETLSAQIPGLTGILKSSGVSDGEAWALATDPNTLKGLKVIFDTLGGAAKFFTEKKETLPRRKNKRSNQGAPLKILRHDT